ncbi:helix-turn-helix transcriptional regulator [Marinospirillum perlucidum]|uniref:helix-turn-helix transcriptional regulator n=1 Tax=Marinospirillum perlucidum TaxID=1982602 RepID=UPI000DF20372|nr:helix-turn-helix transcriptional regulator [Marinospirillum perlucidum]
MAAYPSDQKTPARPSQAYNELLESIYDSATHPEAFEYFLKKLCAFTQSGSANLSTVNVSEGCFVGGWIYGFKKEDLALYMEENLINQDPIAQKIMSSPPGQFIAIRKIIDWESFKQETIYKRWVEPQDIIDSAGCMIKSEGSIQTTLFIQRKTAQGPFTDEEVHFLNSLVPHIQRSVSLYLRLAAKDMANQTLPNVLDALATPTILLDSRGLVKHVNTTAQAFMTQRGWISIENNLLTSSVKELRNRFNSFLMTNAAYIHAEQGSGQSVIHTQVGGEHLAFCMQQVDAAPGSGTNGGALLFIHHQEQWIDERKVPVIAELFHLTPAEARVALLLAQGMSIEAIANYLQRQNTTVRTQLKSVFSKTGTNSQGQLVSLLLTSPVFLT